MAHLGVPRLSSWSPGCQCKRRIVTAATRTDSVRVNKDIQHGASSLQGGLHRRETSDSVTLLGRTCCSLGFSLLSRHKKENTQGIALCCGTPMHPESERSRSNGGHLLSEQASNNTISPLTPFSTLHRALVRLRITFPITSTRNAQGLSMRCCNSAARLEQTIASRAEPSRAFGCAE